MKINVINLLNLLYYYAVITIQTADGFIYKDEDHEKHKNIHYTDCTNSVCI